MSLTGAPVDLRQRCDATISSQHTTAGCLDGLITSKAQSPVLLEAPDQNLRAGLFSNGSRLLPHVLRPRHSSISRVEALVKTSRGRKVMTSPDMKLPFLRLARLEAACNQMQPTPGIQPRRCFRTQSRGCPKPIGKRAGAGKLISKFRRGPDQADPAQCFF